VYVRVNEWQRSDQKGLASAISINKVGYCRSEVYFSGPLPCHGTVRCNGRGREDTRGNWAISEGTIIKVSHAGA